MTNQKIAILADSCNDIPAEFVQRYPIYTLPLLINYKDATYKDRVNISPEEVYRRFSEEIPKTSLPLHEDIQAVFDQIKADGYTHVVASIISSGLSGTYQAIRLFAEEYEGLTIDIVDTLNIGIGSGFFALHAGELIREGMDFEVIMARLKSLVKKSDVFFGVKTLEYLIKGGRIGKVQGILGSAFKIKPIISCDAEGIYDTVAKVRGRNQSIAKMVKLAREKVGSHKDFYIALCHGDAQEEMLEMKESLKDLIGRAKLYSEGQISPVLGVHTGPGLLGVGVMILD